MVAEYRPLSGPSAACNRHSDGRLSPKAPPRRSVSTMTCPYLPLQHTCAQSSRQYPYKSAAYATSTLPRLPSARQRQSIMRTMPPPTFQAFVSYSAAAVRQTHHHIHFERGATHTVHTRDLHHLAPGPLRNLQQAKLLATTRDDVPRACTQSDHSQHDRQDSK